MPGFTRDIWVLPYPLMVKNNCRLITLTCKSSLLYVLLLCFTESDTTDDDGHKVIRAFYASQSDNKRRRKNDWPKDRGEYCHFVMYKENKDTMQAINLLAKCLRIKPDRFSYAGTKDGRAITVQSVSVFRIDARNLQGLNKVLNKVHVGNFEFKKVPLKLGDLKGNTFVVVLRNVDGSDEQIEAGMSSLKDIGFINYYGLQRFGSSRNATHAIGEHRNAANQCASQGTVIVSCFGFCLQCWRLFNFHS